jgi:potassium-transporting ATPase KdpC subunit
MFAHLRASLWLLVLSLMLCCAVYPAVLLVIGQTVFHAKAEGSLVYDGSGAAIGSRLIAQPFTGDQYFFPRPSAASYNAAASGATNWGANNYLLRDRVARTLGPIVKYRGGPNKGQLVASDVEAWFQKDQFQGNSGIVAQWANLHSTLATNWVKADPLNAAYVTAWQTNHTADVEQWKKDNPSTPEPKPEELAIPFFVSFSSEYPGKFPSAVTPEGSTEKKIEPVGTGSDIHSIFFDMWRQEHADADLEPVPADMVMASGSGLDPHITLKNALYQLDRVAGKWAEITQRDQAAVRKEIETLLEKNAKAPLGGLVGVKLVNVLETNLALKGLFESSGKSGK